LRHCQAVALLPGCDLPAELHVHDFWLYMKPWIAIRVGPPFNAENGHDVRLRCIHKCALLLLLLLLQVPLPSVQQQL
jgi:hypothetical protein